MERERQRKRDGGRHKEQVSEETGELGKTVGNKDSRPGTRCLDVESKHDLVFVGSFQRRQRRGTGTHFDTGLYQEKKNIGQLK